MSDDLIRTGEMAAAEALWAELRSALARFDRVLSQIIAARAWEPLGYDTFSQAWADRMSGTRLGTAAMAAQVVYALIEDGLDRGQALLTLGPSSGVGLAKFDTLAHQFHNGVAVEDATIFVRRHIRGAAQPPHMVHVELSHDEWLHFRAVADGRGLDLVDEWTKAGRAHFRRLERRSDRVN